MLLVKAPAFFQNGRAVVAGMEGQQERNITVIVGGIRLDLDCAAIGGDRLIELGLVLEGVAEINVELREIGFELKSRLKGGDRLIEPFPLSQKGGTQIEMGVGKVRLETHRLLKAGLCLGRPLEIGPGKPQVLVCQGIVGLDADGLL